MLYFLYIHCMVIILFIQVPFLKSADISIEIENQSEINSEDLQLADNVGIHDNYRPKHKYKFGNGYQDISKRSSDVSEEVQDDSPSQYAIMFKNNEPVGILQPFEDSFRFLPINGEASLVELSPVPINPAPTKKKGIMDFLKPVAPRSETNEDKSDNKVGFFDERYPSILAKFKIESRIAASRHQLLKRATESTEITNTQQDSLKSTMSKIKSADNVQVEEQLKDILDDMGLIDDYPNREEKREVAENENQDVEDENLEVGTNKINLLKENQKDFRDKRYSQNEDAKGDLTSTNSEKVVTECISSSPLKDNECHEKTNECQGKDLREKRENIEGNIKFSESNDFLVKNTISSENEELNSYEKRVEREIRDKIEKLKQEVKEEIENLAKSRKAKLSEDYRRKKRQASPTLIDEETKEIDPVVNNLENDNVHIRRKRHLNFDQEMSSDTHKVNVNTSAEAIQNPIHVRRKRLAIDNAEMYFKNSEETAKDGAIDMFEASDKCCASWAVRQTEDATKKQKRFEKGESQANVCEMKNLRTPPVEIIRFLHDIHILESSPHKENDDHMSAQDVIEASPNGLSQPSFIFEPLDIDKRSCTNCKNSCDKKGNCKSGSQISDETEFVDKNSMSAHLRDSDMDFSLPETNIEDKEDSDLKDQEGNSEERQHSRIRTPRKTNGAFQFIDGEYFIDQHPALYKLTPVDSVEDFESSKSGEMDGSRLYTIKKSIIPHSRFRRRTQTENNQPIQLIDMSAEDIFGALPQSYEGDLVRYKRVKRARIRK